MTEIKNLYILNTGFKIDNDLFDAFYNSQRNFKRDELIDLIQQLFGYYNCEMTLEESISIELRQLFKPQIIIDGGSFIYAYGTDYPIELLKDKTKLIEWLKTKEKGIKERIDLDGTDIKISQTVCKVEGKDPKIEIMPLRDWINIKSIELI
ncbi:MULTISPECIES: hypothetical protein [Cecembia]|uniref:Uncharacterized protein n=2 Tax=Cecembia TaxID=1187078 RepID=A0A4Q7P5U8_9BACT|nr:MULTISPECIES: hypothetical protein [Cecembia]PSL03027.1 hypothetical protein CLV48_108137 [Cecembia rubra]RZS95351.1 hypothetical protein BC751_0873 [Cecembia calidifontis]